MFKLVRGRQCIKGAEVEFKRGKSRVRVQTRTVVAGDPSTIREQVQQLAVTYRLPLEHMTLATIIEDQRPPAESLRPRVIV